MGARLRLFLSPEEDYTLFELRRATTVPQRVKDRAQIIRLNAQGWYVEKIATHFHCHPQTVRQTLYRWQDKGLGGLWDKPHPGASSRWQTQDIEHLESCLRNDPRTYNSKQLARKLASERQVNLSPGHLRQVLQKRGVIWKRTRPSHRDKQNPIERAVKQADLDMLQWSAACGEIDLFFLDEAGFSLWMPTEYSYFFRGEQKRLEQTSRWGKRISILGLLQPLVSFVYGLVVGGFNSERYIKMMDEQARCAQQRLAQTGQIRVVVQDNSPIHTSKAVRQKWNEWEAKGLYLFFLPKYCSEMNPIEPEWHQLKAHEICGRMFEHELDLAYAVINGVEARAEAGEYSTERFKFPSQLAAS